LARARAVASGRRSGPPVVVNRPDLSLAGPEVFRAGRSASTPGPGGCGSAEPRAVHGLDALAHDGPPREPHGARPRVGADRGGDGGRLGDAGVSGPQLDGTPG